MMDLTMMMTMTGLDVDHDHAILYLIILLTGLDQEMIHLNQKMTGDIFVLDLVMTIKGLGGGINQDLQNSIAWILLHLRLSDNPSKRSRHLVVLDQQQLSRHLLLGYILRIVLRLHQ